MPYDLPAKSSKLPRGCIVFCATQRTGSTMIFDDFRNLLGCEPIYSERLYEEIILKKEPLAWPALWKQIEAEWPPGSVPATKIMFRYAPQISHHIVGLPTSQPAQPSKFVPADFEALAFFFADAIWVHVRRQDVFAQAVSMYLAEATQVWEDRAGGATSASTAPPPPYDTARMLSYLRKFVAEREQWSRFFGWYGIKPLTIDYEHAVAEYPQYMAPLLARAGLAMLPSPAPRRLFKLGTPLNETYATRLRADARREPDLGKIV